MEDKTKFVLRQLPRESLFKYERGKVKVYSRLDTNEPREVLINVVKGQTPSMGQFGVGIANMVTSSSVLMTIFVLKLIVALALEVDTYSFPFKTLTCVSVESDIPSHINDISTGKETPQPNVLDRLTGKQWYACLSKVSSIHSLFTPKG